jgi:hypothetical protein
MARAASDRHRTRRAIALVTLAIPLAAIVVTMAVAAVTTQVTIKASISPSRLGPPSHPTPVKATLEVRMTADPALHQPPTLDKAMIYLPHHVKLYGAFFPSCTVRTLLRRGNAACPKGSQIGSGSATGSVQFGTIRATVGMALFNGPGGKTVIAHIQAFNPLLIDRAVVTKIEPQHGRYAYKITISIPHNIQEILPGWFTGVEHLKVTVGATRTVQVHGRGVTHGWAEAWCPKGQIVPIHSVFTFISDGVHPRSDPAIVDAIPAHSCS